MELFKIKHKKLTRLNTGLIWIQCSVDLKKLSCYFAAMPPSRGIIAPVI